MSVLLSSKVGGGGYRRNFVSGVLTIASGSTGTLVTLTPPAGQKVRLEALQAVNSTTNAGNITVVVGADTVVTAKQLDGNVGAGNFTIGIQSTQNGGNPSAIQSLTGSTDEVIVISVAGSTLATIYYNYSFGV